MLYIFIYSGTKEFESSLKFLRKSIKINFAMKYRKYGE